MWRHIDNSAGKAIIWVAEVEGDIVSHICAVPLKAKQFSDNVIIVRGGDAITKPEYKGQGIFTD